MWINFRIMDSLLLFGAWSAHEDDPERAVFAGLLMRLSWAFWQQA